ncbi:TPA: hypothetical protein DCW61_03225 [Candidatus Uhrbacteria bacterium]|nr:hypothetical protein [Candidatus Uhrbacteria bacterium]
MRLIHADPVRIDARGAGVDAVEQVHTPDRLVCSHAPNQLDSSGHCLEVTEETLLFTPHLGPRVSYDALAEHVPAAGNLLGPGELLVFVGVPAAFLAVKVTRFEFTDVQERHLPRRARHEVVLVAAAQPLQYLLAGERTLEFGDLLGSVGQTASSGDLLGGDKVVAEDLSSKSEVGCLDRETVNECRQRILELPAMVGEALQAVLIGLGGIEGVLHEAQDVLLLTGRDVGHRFILLS